MYPTEPVPVRPRPHPLIGGRGLGKANMGLGIAKKKEPKKKILRQNIMNYSKYKKAQELDNVIKNTEDLIRKAEAFSKKIDEVEERVAMIVVGNNRLYLDKDITKMFLLFVNKYLLQDVENKKKEFKSL